MINPFMVFRIILALTAWIVILYDNYRHKDLKLVAFAYTFLVLGSISSAFLDVFLEFRLASEVFNYLTHIFAVLLAGFLFALTAYTAHKKMKKVEEKTKMAFKGLKG